MTDIITGKWRSQDSSSGSWSAFNHEGSFYGGSHKYTKINDAGTKAKGKIFLDEIIFGFLAKEFDDKKIGKFKVDLSKVEGFNGAPVTFRVNLDNDRFRLFYGDTRYGKGKIPGSADIFAQQDFSTSGI